MSCFKKCFKLEPGGRAAQNVDKGAEWMFVQAADFLTKTAADYGFTMPEDIEDKLYRVGIKAGMVPMREQDERYYEEKRAYKESL